MNTFLTKLIDWNTLKRVLWYAGAQALVTCIAVLSGYIDSVTEPTLTTVLLGLAVSQITKAINDAKSN